MLDHCEEQVRFFHDYSRNRCKRKELKAREKAEEVLGFLDLYMYRKERVGDLPFGVQKIVGLARALAGEPSLLLLDELGSGLMREEKESVARFILRIHHEAGTSIILIEHDMQLVTDICDRLICLNFGRKIKEGKPEEVVSDPAVIEAYVGRRHGKGPYSLRPLILLTPQHPLADPPRS
ncbi:MAG: hypothetical protein ABII26_13175 [Pseudomonadota bacterium]